MRVLSAGVYLAGLVGLGVFGLGVINGTVGDMLATPQPAVTSIELVDGELHVKRFGGDFCAEGWSCDVIHPPGFDHCMPYLEIYGAVDGEVILLRTVRPEIIEATKRQVIWP